MLTIALLLMLLVLLLLVLLVLHEARTADWRSRGRRGQRQQRRRLHRRCGCDSRGNGLYIGLHLKIDISAARPHRVAGRRKKRHRDED